MIKYILFLSIVFSTMTFARQARVDSHETDLWFDRIDVFGKDKAALKTEKIKGHHPTRLERYKVMCFKDRNAKACNEYGYFKKSLKENEKARVAWEYGCYLRNQKSCFNLGHYYFRAKRPETSIRYLKPVCDEGHAKGCFYLGVLYQRKHEFKPMQVRYKRSCDLGVARACYNLASWLRTNHGEVQKAHELELQACVLGLKKSCPERVIHHRDTRRHVRDVHVLYDLYQ
ncbi:MAG: sel1 repeat family protein [Bacteriovoracaceae bacterium]|jgi:hypothetical protein|nr:sel1 repeat family protein [Bacteriovoracaceae bacterium]